MKMNKNLKSMLLVAAVAFAGAALAEEPADTGKKIYDRAFGRGCATCHGVTAPDLFESVNKLSRDDFVKIVKEGKAGTAMPPALANIMGLPFVKKDNLTEDQAIDALIAYLKAGKK